MKNWLSACVILTLFNSSWAFGQQPAAGSGESHKYRTIFTVAGGGGGFALGVVGGLAAFDDATNSDRKVWTTAVLSAVGGAVGGYFLGRSLDRRAKKRSTSWTPGAITQTFDTRQPSTLTANWSSGLSARNPVCDRRAVMAESEGSFAAAVRLSQPSVPCRFVK